MSTNKHATIRYLALDKCFRNPGRKYFMEDLVQVCNDALFEYSETTKGVEKRTVFDDIKFMESSQGWSIDLERHKDGRKVYYRYADTGFSINNHLLNESEENQLKEVLLTLSRFKGMPQFEWIDEMVIRLESSFSLKANAGKIIEFEQNQFLKGLEFFSALFNAILYRKTLEVQYKGFKQEKPVVLCFHPYYLKQYNNRWFVFGRTNGRENMTNMAIDRIQHVKDSKTAFVENDLVNFDEFFEDMIGVSESADRKPEMVKLQIDKDLWPYIESKPLHGSQKLVKKTAEYTIISLTVHRNYELTAQLFSLGEKLKVIEPDELAKEIKLKAKQLIKNYS
jgi:predicted DNA-binding transcriptional regulator YafY